MESRAQVSHNLVYVIQAVTLLVLLAFQWVRWQRRAVAVRGAAAKRAADDHPLNVP